jgi:tetratricopeptide (TPR) repeat protein
MLARASEVEPRRGGIFLNLGVIAWQTGKKNVARDMFVKAASYPSSVQDACNNEANILLLGGELKNALKIYKKADKAGGKNEVVIYNMGRAYMALGRLREAATCFDDVLLMSSDRMDVLTARADLAARLNNKESEEQFLRKIVRLDPRNRVILSRLVDMKIEDGNLEDAVEFCKSALKEFPGDRTLRLLLPSIYAKIGWHEVAVVEYENLIADDEFTKDFVCYSGMGKSMYSLITAKNHRNYQAAIDTLARAADLDPSNPEIPLMIGEIYLGYLFEPAKAKPYLNKALEKALDNEMRKTIREKLLEADK